MQPKRIEILGVPVDCVTMDEAVDFADEMVRTGRQGCVIAVNPEKVIKAGEDPALLAQLRAAALLIPDGIGMVWATRLLGLGHMERVPGADLMPRLCERAAEQGYSVFLYGASESVNRRACDELVRRYPRLQIAGSSHGFRKEQEMPALLAEIDSSGADILFVALGSPRQELWMEKYLSRTTVKLCQGVGGTFDVLAGTVRRAPVSWRNLHLEWAYRLLSQPRRLLRQTALPKFAWRVLMARLSRID